MASSSEFEKRRPQAELLSEGEDGDYESDSEGTCALALRRRKASDDEEEDGPQAERGRRLLDAALSEEDEQEIRSRHAFSDDDVDDEGAAPDEEEEEEEEEEEQEAAEDEEDASRSDLEIARRTSTIAEEDDHVVKKADLTQQFVEPKTSDAAIAVAGGVAEQKKDSEPFVVPTTGAFYMHDDRFRENGGARAWRTAGGRRLWEVKDEKPWVHDRFEELNLNDENFYGKDSHGKRGRGRSRGRGRGRGRGRAPRYSRGEGGRDRVSAGILRGNENIGSSFSQQYGLGSRRQGTRRSMVEDDTVKEISVPASKDKVRASEEITPSTSSSLQASAKAPETSSPMVAKPASVSTLNYASPPFYPSGSFQHRLLVQIGKGNQEIEEQQKGRGKESQGDARGIGFNVLGQGMRNSDSITTTLHSSNLGYSSNSIPTVDAGQDKTQNILKQQVLKTGATLMQQQQPSEPNQKPHPCMEQPLPAGSLQQKTNDQLQLPSFNFLRMQQPPLLKQGQNLHEESQPASDNLSTSSKMVTDVINFPSSQANQSKNIGIGRGGRGSPLEVGRGSFGYSSMGLTSGLRSGDPSFPSASTMVPIVQFNGRPQGGLGVPTVGVALPTYSGQPQFGFGNSEVTWVPILAGGGSMGPAGYNSSYMTLDGSPQTAHYRQPTVQAASLNLPGRDPIAARPTCGWKPPLKSELGNEDFGQRQSKPRRYSEMNFGQ